MNAFKGSFSKQVKFCSKNELRKPNGRGSFNCLKFSGLCGHLNCLYGHGEISETEILTKKPCERI